MGCEHSCARCHNNLCMRKVPIFSSLDSDNLAKIAELIRHRDYKKGEVIFTEGEKTDAIVIINKGSVKALKYTPDGREQILYVFSEGDFFGEQYLISEKSAAYTVEALEQVNACLLTKTQFQKLLYTYPDISVKIIAELGKRMMHMENTIQSMGIRNIDARIAAMLLEYSVKYGTEDKDGVLINLPLSREGMANYMGIARETMSRKLSQFENEGIIRSINNKTVLVPDKNTLEDVAGCID